MTFTFHTEAQGLVEVPLSAILGPFGSNQLMLCPQGSDILLKFALPPSLLFHCDERDGPFSLASGRGTWAGG